MPGGRRSLLRHLDEPELRETSGSRPRVSNRGTRDGDEVVQVYVSEPIGSDPTITKPRQRLAGFRRVAVKAGATEEVVIPFEIARLRFWDEKTHAFRAEPGTYTVRVGGNSDQLPVSATFTVAP